MAELLAASLFVVGYLAIALEHRFFISKAATAIVLAVALWIVASLVLPADSVVHFLQESSVDIFGIMLFLLTAMTLVEVLVHYHFFDVIEQWLRRHHWTPYMMGWVITFLTFFLSAFLDNLTTTIVMIQIARRLFQKDELLPMAALIVIAANAGGAFSPIGDVTTIMLWFAEKFTAWEVISQGVLPSFVLTAVSAMFLLRYIRSNHLLPRELEKSFRLSRSDKAIIVITMASFLFPLAASSFNLPPYLGLLAGLGLVWLLVDLAKQARPQQTHLDAHIKTFLQKTDIESIQFFVGILLAVGALHALGLLDVLTHGLLGEAPSAGRLFSAFVGLGAGSAVIDNVPLTAAAISSVQGVSASWWVLLALMVGTGGSMLVIGSAAGVVAMGMVEKMTFVRYLRLATVPSLIGFVAAALVWGAQYLLFLQP
jgi:Na+/H+ antiporter NhaD/arsenite permease-like protein